MCDDKCSRADLLVGVPQTTYWSVTDDGTVDWYQTEGEADTKRPEGYYCNRCGEWFIPDPANGDFTEAVRDAWQAALAHLKGGVMEALV